MSDPPTSTETGIAERYRDVLRRIDAACARAGRAPGDVRLVAVSKTVGVERIRELLACGHDLLGENRVQEAMEKMDRLGAEGRFHLIGHLQRNKARHAVGRFEMIHGLDNVKLAEEIERRAAAAAIRQQVLVQVKLGGEESKSGVAPDGLDALLEAVAPLGHLHVRGLMAIPPPESEPARSRRWFAALRELRDAAARSSGLPLPELSMGMSDDFEPAIEEGATLVRVGRSIFGERPPARVAP
jgi:pyridoxal phosphate enzyme (YggS family)